MHKGERELSSQSLVLQVCEEAGDVGTRWFIGRRCRQRKLSGSWSVITILYDIFVL